ncbi:MAG: hypothetical protein AAB250_08885, partial [Bdellovibrionota bacterium]
MKKLVLGLFGLLGLAATPLASAASDGYFVGIGLYAQNSLSKTTKSDDGSGSLFGAYSFPLVLRYSTEVSTPWSIAPAFYYTILPRSSGGGTATTTFLHLSIPAVYSFTGASHEYELLVGPGLSMYQIRGAGGTKQLSNGTGTSTFAIPGGDATSKLVTLDLG